ncbi:MAG TPA: CvpA family protein [Terracidiphilus sp.]|nr:CvpA family protein [Terracidiphilus sp.]
MTWVDWAIVIMLAGFVLAGLVQGFFRTACSLVGLIVGLSLAAWNYWRIAALLIALVKVEAIADAIGFFFIAIVVFAIANLIGKVLAKALEWMGLGCLDMLAGAVLGFFQGLVFVTLCVLVGVAFFPEASWLKDSRLPKQFFGALHMSMRATPGELTDKIREGFHKMELETPDWAHPKNGVS